MGWRKVWSRCVRRAEAGEEKRRTWTAVVLSPLVHDYAAIMEWAR